MGKAWVFEGSIDTDVLAPGRYMKFGIEEIARHCMEAIDPAFASTVRPGDVVVGPRNFGLGSSREQAPAALRHLGVAAVLAPSFSGLFYRNAINVGQLVLECPEAGTIAPGDDIRVDAAAGRVHNLTQDRVIACEPVPAHLLAMIEAGGLLPWLEQRIARGERLGRR
jgi:3-isopropylmalate/(R)-2-methylmalate dehydratase small subunit